MRKTRRPFEQKQAAIGRGREETPPSSFFDEVLVILRRFESEQGEPKSVLTRRFSVAAAAIAAGLGENRDDLVWKIDRGDLVETFDYDGQRCGKSIGRFRRNAGVAIH